MSQLNQTQFFAPSLAQEAAARIIEELDARGFTAEDATQSEGLENKITAIIVQTLRGNTNYCVSLEN